MNSRSATGSASTAASTSQRTLDEENPLREKRRQVREAHSRLAQIRHVKGQLEHLSTGSLTVGSSTPSSPSSWAVPPAFETGTVSSELTKEQKFLVPFSRAAFIPASISFDQSAKKGGGQGGLGKVWMRKGNASPALLETGEVVFFDGLKDEIPSGYEQVAITEAIARLKQEETTVASELENLRTTMVKMASESLEEHLAGQSRGGGGGSSDQNSLEAPPIDAQGQAVNEEGLPFVDPVEPYVEDDERRKSTAPPPMPLQQRDTMTKESRRKWVTSVLDQLEAEEKGEGMSSSPTSNNNVSAVGDRSESPKSMKEKRPTSHRRLSSADRPAPVKSVLKQTGPIPPPLARFGSSGIRRGFLNLNPSSPAAEHSSDPVDSIDYSQSPQGGGARLYRSDSTNMADSLTSAAGSEDSNRDERLSRSMELPPGNPGVAQQQKRKKKTVRIQSPVREASASSRSDHRVWPNLLINGSTVVHDTRDANDEDVGDEAKSIVDLLGIEAIKDHPQAGGFYKALKESEAASSTTKQPAAAPLAPSSSASEKEKPKKPAVSQSVLERSSKPSAASTTNTNNKQSAFKRGFLVNPPAARVAKRETVDLTVPQGPKVSQGISALERATNSDKGLEEEREKQGLKPSVPHARPSKAFAAKMEAKRRGEDVSRLQTEQQEEEADSEGPDSGRKSRVRFGDEEENGGGKVAVKIGTAASPATHASQQETDAEGEEEEEQEDEADDEEDNDEEEEERLNSIGMHIREEDLDDDTVEALGYFSDEDFDPDLGWDEDDLEQLRPDFSADAEVISNDELRREYERVKASLARHSSSKQQEREYQGDDLDSFIEGADLEMVEKSSSSRSKEHTAQPKASKFKQDRARRILQGQTVRSNELGTGQGQSLEGAKNVGPSMLIPSIANVRFPKAGQTLTEGREIELEGGEDSDDDDAEGLEEMMRQRLSQFHHRDLSEDREGERIVPAHKSSSPGPPPVVAAAATQAAPTSTSTTGQAPAKKPSLFKSRMSQK